MNHVAALVLVLLWIGCASGAGAPATADPDALLVVDCLLPGSVRRLGQAASYVTPRRPVKTSAIECRILGGEYTERGRADAGTALQVWLPVAQTQDPEAQNYVGEIYERGMGLAPDYEAAAIWYRRAAEQGHAAAQVNLGQLYEKGLGVPRYGAIARTWYRLASGLPDVIAPTPSSDYDGVLYATRMRLERLEKQFLRSTVVFRLLRCHIFLSRDSTALKSQILA